MGPGKMQFKGMVFTLLALAVFLPILLTTTLNPQSVNFLSKASTHDPLRIWLEPVSVNVANGQSFKLSVMAEFNDADKTLLQLKMSLRSDEDLILEGSSLAYTTPFRGRVKVGEVRVTAVGTGEKRVWIDDNSIDTGLPDLPVVSAGTNVSVR